MNILFRIDQRSALLRGINAPHSTMRIEIDPSLLTEAHRKLLANSLNDDLTSKIQIVAPDYAGVMAALEEHEATEREVDENHRANAANLVGRCELALETHKAGEPLKYIETYYSDPRSLVKKNPIMIAYSEAYEKERIAEEEQRTQKKLAAKLATEVAEAAYLAAKLEVLRVAGEHELIARHHARLAPEEEFERTVKKHLLAPLGLEPGHVDWADLDGRRALNATLSASEFARYQEVAKAIPDAVNEILSLQVWRDAEGDEEGDGDGEVLAFAGKWVRFTWTDAATGLEIDRAYRLDS